MKPIHNFRALLEKEPGKVILVFLLVCIAIAFSMGVVIQLDSVVSWLLHAFLGALLALWVTVGGSHSEFHLRTLTIPELDISWLASEVTGSAAFVKSEGTLDRDV